MTLFQNYSDECDVISYQENNWTFFRYLSIELYDISRLEIDYVYHSLFPTDEFVGELNVIFQSNQSAGMR